MVELITIMKFHYQVSIRLWTSMKGGQQVHINTHDEATFLGTMMCVQRCHDEYLPKLKLGYGTLWIMIYLSGGVVCVCVCWARGGGSYF